MQKKPTIRGKSKKKRQQKARLLMGAWILSMALVTIVVYWLVAGKEQYANTCYSDGEAAMMVGIYPEANRYFQKAIRYSNAPLTLRTQIRRIYLNHFRSWEERGDYQKAERVARFLLAMFPQDEEIRHTVEELTILLVPTNDLQVRASRVYPGVNGRFLKNGNLLLQDFRERWWILDPEKSVTRRVFPLRNERFLAASPTARYAAVILAPKKKEQTGVLAFLNQEGMVVTKTNLSVAASSVCTWSPDENTVAVEAFSTTGDPFLCLVDAATGETKQFRGTGIRPSWSPQGDSIAFLAQLPPSEDASFSLAINSLEGDTAQRLCPLENEAGMPLWSPKGDALLIRTRKEYVAYSTRGAKVFGLPLRYAVPTWAPTGTKLATVVPGSKELSILDRNGKTARIPTTLPITGCEWSPEGSKLALNFDDGKDRFLNLVSLGKKTGSEIAKPTASKILK